MDEILLLLLQKKAHLRPLRMTTSEIGQAIGMSQQNASRRIIMLEEDGSIERTDEGLLLREKAVLKAGELYASLKAVMEPSPITLRGKVEDGLGEGRYYLSLEGYRKQIKEKLGFIPFPGTLNVRLRKEDLWKRSYILSSEPIVIAGFRDEKRSYGDLYAYRCRIKDRECALIVPLRTHHGPEVLEIIAQDELKRTLGILQGSEVEITL
jgi:riboflavin kinase